MHRPSIERCGNHHTSHCENYHSKPHRLQLKSLGLIGELALLNDHPVLIARFVMNATAKTSLELVLVEFRNGIAHHRAEGATEEQIRQILSASIRLVVQKVEDPELCTWLCDEFSKAARMAPMVNDHPLNVEECSPYGSNLDGGERNSPLAE